MNNEQCFSLSACGVRQVTEEWGELNINWHLEAFGAFYTQFWAAYGAPVTYSVQFLNDGFSVSDQNIFRTVLLNFQRIVPVSYGFYVVSHTGLSCLLD
jgi:hypothetical protein